MSLSRFPRAFPLRYGALARLAFATAAAAAMLSIPFGLQGCIENPGPDHRLNQEDREYHVLTYAQYADESVLELSMKRDSGALSLRILSLARQPIDSAALLLQFGDWSSFTAPGWYQKDVVLEVLVRIADLQPGAVLEYGAISRDIELGETYASARLIRYADGAPRGNPLGGVYSGDYSLVDTAGNRYSGLMEGIITVDGKYHFLMESTGRGIRGDIYGMLDSAGRGEGKLREDAFWGPDHPMSLPTPLTVSDPLKGTFRTTESTSKFDSLDFDLHPMSSLGK